MIDAKFDFEADLRSWKLPLTIIVIIAYFIFLLRTSDREYRQVIDAFSVSKEFSEDFLMGSREGEE